MFIKDFPKEKKNQCQGTVFRANVSNWYNSSRIEIGFKVKLKKIKKLSCDGCESCGWEHDDFSEISNKWPVNKIESAEHGKLYTITTCNESRDWETGTIDEWDLELIEYKGELK